MGSKEKTGGVEKAAAAAWSTQFHNVLAILVQRINLSLIHISPHVDALFDEVLLSFEQDGTMLVHPSLPNDVLERWSIKKELKVEPFLKEHSKFLDHHRMQFATKMI